MAAIPVITLITDFGNKDEYVGVMKGVICSINPRIRFVDITHSVPPQDIRRAAFLLYKAYRYFPKGTVHLVVVDPEVGGERDAMILKTEDYYFVGPDNGVFSLVCEGEFEAYRIISKIPRSTTFHGRDIFAPTAAKLASGVSVEDLSEPKFRMVKLPSSKPQSTDYGVLGEVMGIDHFGNAITNIPRSSIRSDRLTVETKNFKIEGISKRYEGKSPIAIWGSSDLLELSLPNGSFVDKYRVRTGDRVKVIVK